MPFPFLGEGMASALLVELCSAIKCSKESKNVLKQYRNIIININNAISILKYRNVATQKEWPRNNIEISKQYRNNIKILKQYQNIKTMSKCRNIESISKYQTNIELSKQYRSIEHYRNIKTI
jgi:hypothetical protein